MHELLTSDRLTTCFHQIFPRNLNGVSFENITQFFFAVQLLLAGEEPQGKETDFLK